MRHLFSNPDDWQTLRRALPDAERAELRRLAEAIAATPAPNVCQKSQIAPSGDPHDFHTLGPYWWPDTDQPSGVPYKRHDGQVNPEIEAYDNPILPRMVKGVATSILAGWIENDPAAYDKATLWLRVWFLDPETRMNPHLEYAQGIPGRCHGRGIGLIGSSMLVMMIDLFPLLAASDRWPPDEQDALLTWFGEYLDWFLASEHGQAEVKERNNHGTWYDLQVMGFAHFIGRDEYIRRQWEAHTAHRIEAQISPEGAQVHEEARTLSLNYSVYNLTAFTGAGLLAASVGVNIDAHPRACRLKAAYRHLRPYLFEPEKWTAGEQIKPYPGTNARWLLNFFPRLFPECTEETQRDLDARAHHLAHLPQWQRLVPAVGEEQPQSKDETWRWD